MKHLTLTAKSFLSLLLSGTLLFNSAAPAFAQVKRPYPTYTPSHTQDSFSSIDSQQQKRENLAQKVWRQTRGALTKEQFARVFEIREAFLPSSNQKNPSDFEIFQQMYQKEIDNAFEYRTVTLNRMYKLSEAQLDKQAKEARYEMMDNFVSSTPHHTPLYKDSKNLLKNTKNSLADSIQNLTKYCEPGSSEAERLAQLAQQEQQILQWRQENQEKLTAWFDENKQALEKWKKQANQEDKKIYEEEYKDKLLAEREEFVKQAVADLWQYKKVDFARDAFLEVAPIILPMQTLQGKSFFNHEQKTWLATQYTQILRRSHTCEKQNDSWCPLVNTAIHGLSLLTHSEQAAREILSVMQERYQTEVAVPTLLAGTSALLSMKQYPLLDSFLGKATREERDLSKVDLFSFNAAVNGLANINGQYLGEVSKFGEYPLEENPNIKSPRGNVWEDIAQLIADDGSVNALELLRKYGVEQCRVSVDNGPFGKGKHSLHCTGITPFLVGALISGKSGASEYHLSSATTQPSQILRQDGSIQTITPQQAANNKIKLQNSEKAFYDYAASMGMTPAAAIARHLFLQSMGDINAETELRVDNLLYQHVYTPQTKQKAPKADFAIATYDRSSITFHNKQIRQERVNFFHHAATLGDIGILVWCVVDITKWARSGIKIGRALSKAARMAREGASVAERATMLRQLNISPKKLKRFVNFRANVRARVTPAVLSQAPQFAAIHSIELPHFTPNVGKVLADGLNFNIKTGELTLASAQTLRQQGLSYQQIQDARTALNTATVKTNTAFANSGLSARRSSAYKGLLLENAATSMFNTPINPATKEQVLSKIRSLSIKVPENIQTFRTATGNSATRFTDKKKLTPLMWAQGLSLSSASSGLIVPLENTYGDQITETDKMLITLALPYAPSALSAFIAPLTKKWGAVNVLKTAFGFSTAGLATAAAFGFRGKVDTENLPPLWPLLVSGTAIGISSALSRASLNILIDNLGGGGSLIKSMMYKNVGSIALLAPPVLWNMGHNFWNKTILGKEIKETDGSDFSLAFPVLGALSIGALTWVSRVKVDSHIGRIEGFLPLEKLNWTRPLTLPKTVTKNSWNLFSGIAKEGAGAWRLMLSKEIWPMVLATTAFTGFEAATLNKAGNQLLKPVVKNEFGFIDKVEANNRKNLTALCTTVGVTMLPLLTRWGSPRVLKAMSSPVTPEAQYRRMLAASYALNIGGGSLLYANGLGNNSFWGWVGFGMLGVGTANV
ncbi:MAG: hypothetical protein IKP96_01730, partial [Elusimicrobiaceae bacterium]|nr:hypothetical protein [Elusimicrobiaceae bacterium]